MGDRTKYQSIEELHARNDRIRAWLRWLFVAAIAVAAFFVGRAYLF